MGTPESESSDTKLWRISLGVHSVSTSPASLRIFRKSRRTLPALSVVPFFVQNTSLPVAL